MEEFLSDAERRELRCSALGFAIEMNIESEYRYREDATNDVIRTAQTLYQWIIS